MTQIPANVESDQASSMALPLIATVAMSEEGVQERDSLYSFLTCHNTATNEF